MRVPKIRTTIQDIPIGNELHVHSAKPIYNKGEVSILEDDAFTPTRYFVMYKDTKVGSRLKISKNHAAFCRAVLTQAAKNRERFAELYRKSIKKLEESADRQLQFAQLFSAQANLIPKTRKKKNEQSP